MEKLNHRTKRIENKCLPMVIFVFLALLLPCPVSAQDALEPEAYLGPTPGYVYYYKADNGQKMILHGLIRDINGGVVIEKTTTFLVEAELRGKCINKLSKAYVLFTDKGRIIKKGFGLSRDGYSIELDLANPVWGNQFTMMKTGSSDIKDGTKMTSECKVINRGKQLLFGKERTVLEVVGKYCVSSKYASGIGLIDLDGMKLVGIEEKMAEDRNY